MTKANPPPPEIIKKVVSLGIDGLGNKAIAEKVPEVNPNQIAGILHRAGVKRKKKNGKKKMAKKQPRVKEVSAPVEEVPEPIPPAPARPSPEELHLLPKDDQCKWPSGNNPIKFLCENKKLSGCPYCAPHMRMAGGHR